ncbi:hypothetical protein FB451DRAFT_1562439 [Mycena latifolia]|nr:hypothetical protein FB451DRAFT_1562439 [Mycena latifolia]
MSETYMNRVGFVSESTGSTMNQHRAACGGAPESLAVDSADSPSQFLSFTLMGSPRRVPVRRDSEQALRCPSPLPLLLGPSLTDPPQLPRCAVHRSAISSPPVPCRTASAHDDLPSHALLHHLEAAEGKEHTETKVHLTMFLSSP